MSGSEIQHSFAEGRLNNSVLLRYFVFQPMRFVLLWLFLFTFLCSKGQSKYWVFFRDKQGTKFNPFSYFDPKAIERRSASGIQLYDSSDFPLNEQYKNSVAALCDSLGAESRWFNAIAVYSDNENIKKIKKLSFVKEIELVHSILTPASRKDSLPIPEKTDTALLTYQTHRLQAEKFRKAGINGKGIRIAVLDVGFPGVDRHPAFRHLRENKQIIATYDFIKKREDVYHFDSHGTSVLSCMAGIYEDSIQIGMAQGAEFLLARTERDHTEWKDEEDFWLAAVEWADKNGANIVSSSLAYTYQRYFYRDMNGRKSIVARAATMAAKKGILVIVAAGNNGTDQWKHIATPADADSALTIGGSDPLTDTHIDFSSFGPTAEGHLKPNVIAPAYDVVATGGGNYRSEYGTSFAAPLVAGFAACAWQMKRNLNNMELFREIEKSGHLYPYYDYAHGYGIPQAGYFTDAGFRGKAKPVFRLEKGISPVWGEVLDVLVDTNTVTEFVKQGNHLKHTYIYAHIADAKGTILKYFVVKPTVVHAATFSIRGLTQGDVIRVFMDGYVEEKKF